MSWKRPRSPVTIQVGRPVAAAAPIPEETSPSIPLAPRLARKRTSASPPAQERLLVADRHARGGVDEVAVGVSAAPAPRGGPARSAPSSSGELGLDRLVGRAPRPPARRRPMPASAPPSAPLGQAPRRGGAGSARTIAPAIRVGSFQPSAGSMTSCAASGRSASHARSGLQVGISPKRRTSSGVERVAAARGRSRRRRQIDQRAVVGAEAKLRGRLGEDRIAGRGGERGDRARRRRGRACRPATIRPARRGRDRARRAPRRAARRGGAGAGGDRGQRPLAAALERQRRGRGDVARARGSGPSGSRQATFRWTGPGPRVAARRSRRRGRRPSGSGAGRRRRRRGCRPRRTSAPPSRRA